MAECWALRATIILLPPRLGDHQGRGYRKTVRARGREHLKRGGRTRILFFPECLWLHTQNLGKSKPAEAPAWLGRVPEAPSLTKKLLAADGCLERDESFSSGMWLQSVHLVSGAEPFCVCHFAECSGYSASSRGLSFSITHLQLFRWALGIWTQVIGHAGKMHLCPPSHLSSSSHISLRIGLVLNIWLKCPRFSLSLSLLLPISFFLLRLNLELWSY